MKTQLMMFSFVSLALGSTSFADSVKTVDGAQAIRTIMQMIPLEIRTNAFNGKMPDGQGCRVDIVFPNDQPTRLILAVEPDHGDEVNVVAQVTDTVEMKYTQDGNSGRQTLESESPAWQVGVFVPDLAHPNLRTITTGYDGKTLSCAIDTDRNDNGGF